MKKFIDLIFYKTYLAYEKKNSPGKFVSSLYLSFIFLFLCAPIYGVINDLVIGVPKAMVSWSYGAYSVIIFVSVFYHYGKRGSIAELAKKFGTRNSLNKLPSWPFFLILPLAMVVGIGSYILLSIHVIQKHNMEGALFRFFNGY